MPCSLPSRRARTDSLATIWFTVKCFPTSRRKSSRPIGPTQEELSTRTAPAAKSTSWASWGLIPSTRAATSSGDCMTLSSVLPPGSPTIPVAPPRQGDGPVAGLLQPAQQAQLEQAAHVQAVGGRVETDVDHQALAVQALLEALVGHLVDQPPEAQVGGKRAHTPILSAPGPGLGRGSRRPPSRLRAR